MIINKDKNTTTEDTEFHRGEWKEKKLGDIAEIRMCKRIFAEQTTPNGDIPFYKIGTFGKEPDAYISRSLYEEYKSKYSYPSKGDILLSAAGTLGRTVVYDGKPAYFQDSNIVWLEIKHEQICNEYLYHCYQVMKWASPEGSTISRLYNGIIRDTDIKLPPLPEQRRIAEVLSDTDELIATLEKLIAKKKAIKQGVMQELLTGKRRLPGFSGEWVERKLGDCLIVGHGQSQKNIENRNGKYPILATSGVIGWTNYFMYDKPSVLIGRKGTIDKPQYMETPFWTIDTLFYTIINQDNSAKYLYYLFCTIGWSKLNEASGVPSLSRRVIEDIDVFLPPTHSEQTGIANILSDMDAEIEALSEKLTKFKNIKQGMMSELLTGRIRLVAEKTTNNTNNTNKERDKPFVGIRERTEGMIRNKKYDVDIAAEPKPEEYGNVEKK